MVTILREFFSWFVEQVTFVCSSLVSLLFLVLVMVVYSAGLGPG